MRSFDIYQQYQTRNTLEVYLHAIYIWHNVYLLILHTTSTIFTTYAYMTTALISYKINICVVYVRAQ